MAVEEYNKRSHPADSDDDDVPLVIKRTKTSSKQGQLSLDPNKISSQKREESLGRLACDERSLNGDISNSEKAKVLSTTKLSSEKCTAVSKGSLTSHSSENIKTVSGIELTIDKSQGEVANSDDSDDEKPLRAKFSTFPVTAESIQKAKEGTGNGLEYLEDEKSLSLAGAPTKKLAEYEDQKPSHDARVLKSSMSTSSSSNIDAGTKKDTEDSDDDKPLLSRLSSKSRYDDSSKKSDSDDEKPLSSRLKQNGLGKRDPDAELQTSKTLNKRSLSDGNNLTKSASKKAKLSEASTTVKVKHESVVKKEEKTDGDGIPTAQKMKKSSSSDRQSTMKAKKVTSKKVHMKKNKKKKSKFSMSMPPGSGGGQKWTTLEHNGVIFPPPYKPHGVRMLYNGQPVDLTPAQEEVATMFAVMKETDYATKPKFIENFMNDWREILGKKHVIKKFELCDFTPIYEWHLAEKEKKKQMTTEEKKASKEEKAKQEDKYMWAVVDGVKEKVGNFRVEPPGLFRGRGEHPKMGKLKRRILPKDITINIGKGAPTPECPMPGERWKEVKHDNTVTWLAFWNDPINQKESKYVFLAASSSLKGQSDKEKYEKARTLKKYIADIRRNYTKDFSSKDATKRQIAVATYLIDKLALRAGNEKDDDEADTVGCCTLKVENVVLVPPNKLQFDFLGKDSVRYFNTVEVELPVYKAVGDFRTAKKQSGQKKADGEDLFDMLDTSKLNAHLKELMPGLTAKVFRTYNASITLDDKLRKETNKGTLVEKIAAYQRANKEVAIICNHQRSVSKSHDTQMSKLNEKIDELKAQQEELKEDLSRARKGKPPLKDAEGKTKKNLSPEMLEKKLDQVDKKIKKMESDKTIKEDLKTVALGTSKINYLDPRITVAYCKRLEIPIEKLFNKSLLAKFSWAMDVDPSFEF